MSENFDCVVLGGGPGGSTAAALVAAGGFRTLLVEREKFPRYHIGESLMPETYWTLQRLGVLDKMKASAFPKKFSVQFVSHQGRESQPFYFHDRDPRECSQTWQVERATFDNMLFENAREKGADCRDQTRALDVITDGDRVTGVKLKSADGTSTDVAARVVIDATGQQSLIANKFGLRQTNPRLRKSSIWTYYRAAQRDTGVDEGATIVLHTQDKTCWFWYIPLPDDITSVGVVGEVDYLLQNGQTPAETFAQELARCPNMQERLANAERTEDFRVTRDFTYHSKQPAGPGWVLVGDALGFLDPIYSSGVFLALKSGELAADAVVDALQADDPSTERLSRWVPEYQQGMDLIRNLVYAFYNNDFSFGRFIREYPQHQGNLVDLLVGKVYRPGVGAIFDDMAPYLATSDPDAAESSTASPA